MSKMNAVGWFDIYVNDLERATAFYEAVLDTKLEEMGGPHRRKPNDELSRRYGPIRSWRRIDQSPTRQTRCGRHNRVLLG